MVTWSQRPKATLSPCPEELLHAKRQETPSLNLHPARADVKQFDDLHPQDLKDREGLARWILLTGKEERAGREAGRPLPRLGPSSVSAHYFHDPWWCPHR